ncbi:hypothetical protein V491_05093 [Pseudogymnoascus sp. VKM F-3775]|nr:hypothetical protein V491_05093 [Pseudogymnoascus sp. VKM F-3775]
METPLDNDVRGWIMTIASGIACVLGSSIICIDLVLRHIPRWKHFSIQDSSLFLACSMSLSFGVMVTTPQATTSTRAVLMMLDLLRAVQHAAIVKEVPGKG